MARFDLLRAVQGLAKHFTNWKTRNDEELYKLVCYIQTSQGRKMIGWVGDEINAIQPHLFSDSDFAGTEGTLKSTSGVHLCLRGPHTSFPLSGQSKRQGCVSSSTTEAELVAGSLALRTAGLPIIDVMRVLHNACTKVPTKTVLHFHVDNQAMAAVVRSGRNPTMRQISKTHGICISSMHEQCKSDDVKVEYISTSLMAADIYTKAFQVSLKLNNLHSLIHI